MHESDLIIQKDSGHNEIIQEKKEMDKKEEPRAKLL